MWRQLLAAGTFLVLYLEPVASEKRKKDFVICPAVCEPEKCPNIGPIKISECPQPYLKFDQCGCCKRCDIAHMTTTISPLKRDEVCEKVTCPKKKLCMLNMQGLPMCKCASLDLCKEAPGRKRGKVCGSDGVTYPSRCHIKVVSCQSDKKIRAVSKGECESLPQALPTEPIPSTAEKDAVVDETAVGPWFDKLGEEINAGYTDSESNRKASKKERRRERKRLSRRMKKRKHRHDKSDRRTRLTDFS